MLELLETPVHSPEKQTVLKAISGSPGKVSVADIVTKTSLPVLQATSLLNQIAYETGGHLNVGTAGSIVYEFDRNFQSSYLSRGSKNFFRRLGRICFNAISAFVRFLALAMFFLIRISFGIMLILGIVVVVGLVIVVVLAMLAKMFGGGDDRDGGFEFDLGPLLYGIFRIFRFWAFDWLWDWWFWGRYIRFEPSPSYKQMPKTAGTGSKSGSKVEKESFLDRCFSFLFGEGNPNKNLLERQWQTIALVLKAKQGTLTAEELAPYVSGQERNEDWVLPILVRFNGNCQVTDNGSIIYSFPSFQQKFGQTTGKPWESSPKSDTEASADLHTQFQNLIKAKQNQEKAKLELKQLEPQFNEYRWQFSFLTEAQRMQIIGFAIVLLAGGLWLTKMIFTVPLLIKFSPVLLPLLYGFSAYGAFILIFPAIRYLLIQQINKGIEARNAKRSAAAEKLRSPEPELSAKLQEARKLRQAAALESSEEKQAFTTERDSTEQEFED